MFTRVHKLAQKSAKTNCGQGAPEHFDGFAVKFGDANHEVGPRVRGGNLQVARAYFVLAQDYCSNRCGCVCHEVFHLEVEIEFVFEFVVVEPALACPSAAVGRECVEAWICTT